MTVGAGADGVGLGVSAGLNSLLVTTNPGPGPPTLILDGYFCVLDPEGRPFIDTHVDKDGSGRFVILEIGCGIGSETEESSRRFNIWLMEAALLTDSSLITVANGLGVVFLIGWKVGGVGRTVLAGFPAGIGGNFCVVLVEVEIRCVYGLLGFDVVVLVLVETNDITSFFTPTVEGAGMAGIAGFDNASDGIIEPGGIKQQAPNKKLSIQAAITSPLRC